MCTVIRKRYWKHPKIAKEDIPVYKVGYFGFNDTFFSKYRNTMYLFNEICNTEFSISDDICVSDSLEDKLRDTIPYKERLYIGGGFHSFLTLNRVNESNREYNNKIAVFIIPKGALYYLNKAENVVSNQIIFKHFI